MTTTISEIFCKNNFKNLTNFLAVIDASLIPMLAWIVDKRYENAYGSVYAPSQSTVCLAYGLGPLLGGWLMGAISFQW